MPGRDERINAGWPAYEEALKANKVKLRDAHLPGHAARLQQRHHAALRRRCGEAGVAAHGRLLQQVSPHVTRGSPPLTLGRAFIEAAKRRPSAFCMADSTGQELTFARALTASLLLAGVIRRTTPGQRYVGLLLPASVGGALANVATTLAGKVAGEPELYRRPRRDGGRDRTLRHQERSSRPRLPREGRHRADRRDGVPRGRPEGDPARESCGRRSPHGCCPYAARRGSMRARRDADALATVIFSSGSTGIPKGVMLTHRNILANVDADSAGLPPDGPTT